MKTLARMTVQKLSRTLVNYLKTKGYNPKATKKYIIAEGNLPICLVAHMDTVSPTPPADIYYDREKCIMWSPQLLGADDRAGIYAIIQILNAGYRPSVIFTTDEEVGALGAKALVSQIPNCPLENLKAIFQLDRCGENDCVFYDCDNRDFVDYVESFGFEENFGSFSDISVIAPAWGVAAVNLSVGYENEHHLIETLNTRHLDDTIKKVKKICEDSENMLSYAYIPYVYSHSRGRKTTWANWYKPSQRKCICCNKALKNDEGKDFEEKFYEYSVCDDCYSKFF